MLDGMTIGIMLLYFFPLRKTQSCTKICVFEYTLNRANFELFCQVISSSKNFSFFKSKTKKVAQKMMPLNKIFEFSCASSPDSDKLTSSLCCRILACTFSAIIGVVFVVLTTTISTIPLTSTIVVVIITPFISLPLREFTYIHKLLKKNNILVIV